MNTNARSVVNKIDELKIYASLTQPDIIAITETRRTRGDCIETFKMLRGFTKVDNSTWLTLLTRHDGPQTRLSSDPLSLETKPARLDLRKYFFSVRIPPIWNALPLPVRQSTSVNQFKNSYDKFKKNQSA